MGGTCAYGLDSGREDRSLQLYEPHAELCAGCSAIQGWGKPPGGRK